MSVLAPERRAVPAPRRRVRARAVVAVLVALALLVPVVMYPRQIWSLATHWRGAPQVTWEVPPLVGPDDAALRITVLGDLGDSGGDHRAVTGTLVDLARDRPPDVVLLLGDNVYPHGDPSRLPELVFEPLAPVLRAGAELRAVLGNHDVLDGNGDAQIAALGMPGRWWAVERGDVLLIGLDSTRPRDAEQRAFLERTLATTSARWRIVALHHPPYSAGYQGSNRTVRELFTPVFARYGVQLVLSGHDHDYQRSVPLAGVTYVVSGGGGGSRRTGTRSFTDVAWATPHLTSLAVHDDRLVLWAVDSSGRLFDEAVLRP